MSQLTLRRNNKTLREDEEEDLFEFDRGICQHRRGYEEKKIVHSIASGNSTSGLSSTGNCSTYKKGSGNSTSGLSSSSKNSSIDEKGGGNSTCCSSSGNFSHEKESGKSTSGLSSSGNCSNYKKPSGSSTSGLFSSEICSTYKNLSGNSTSGLSTSGNFSTTSGSNSTSGLSSSGNFSTTSGSNSTSGLSSSGNCCTNEKMSHVYRMHNEKILKDLEVGDLVEFNRGIFSHWGVYVGNEQIVHLVTNSNTKWGLSSSGNCCTKGSVGDNSTSGSSSSGNCSANGSVGGNSTSGMPSSGNCSTSGSEGGNSTSGSSSSGNCTTNECGVVIMECFWTVSSDCKATKNNQFDERLKPLAKEKIKKRAIEKLGKHKYNVIWSNCEHFASWCRYDKSCSKQADKSLAIGMVVGTLFIVIFVIKEFFFNKK